MKPPITTLSPVSTNARVLILDSVDSVTLVAVVAITRIPVSPTRQTTTNSGRRRSLFILGELRLRIFRAGSVCTGDGLKFQDVVLRFNDVLKDPPDEVLANFRNLLETTG